MKICNSDIQEKTAVAIGEFNSLHMGHRRLILKAVDKAKEKNAYACVFTFDENLEKHKNSQKVLSKKNKYKIFEDLGVDILYIQKFDNSFKNLSPREFVENILKVKLNCEYVVVGENFKFGKNASGDAEMLRALCDKYGIECEIFPLEKTKKGEIISSSLIRDLAKKGEVCKIIEISSLPVCISGRVVHGRKDGRKMGFPTVNISPDKDTLFCKKGVYASFVEIEKIKYPAITNIGNAPTFEENEEKVEAHIIGFEGELYEENIEIFLLKYMREISKFSSIDNLINQLEKDKNTAITIFKETKYY